MDIEKPTLGRKIEVYLNALNRILIWSSSLYISWHCWHFQSKLSTYTAHVWLCTIGYQLLMTESILSLYTENTWSLLHTPRTKRTLHWVLQLIGSLFAIIGTGFLYYQRRRHFGTWHSLTGLISCILLLIGIANGMSALWAQELRKFIKLKPVYAKFFHNLVGMGAFIVGMISLFFGYEYKYFQESDVKDIRPWLVGVLAMTTILSLIGAFKSSIFQLKNIFRR